MTVSAMTSTNSQPNSQATMPSTSDELQRGGNGVQNPHADDQFDGCPPALHHAAEAAGLALQMEAQRESVQMLERLVGKAANGVLPDPREQHVADLRQHHHHHAPAAIGHDHHDRHQSERGLDGGSIRRREPIDGMLIGKRRDHRDQLRQHQDHAGQHHAAAQVRPILRPYERQQPAHDGGMAVAALCRRCEKRRARLLA